MKRVIPLLSLLILILKTSTMSAYAQDATTLLPLPKHYVEQGGVAFHKPAQSTLQIAGSEVLPMLDLWLSEHQVKSQYQANTTTADIILEKVATIPSAHYIALKGYANEAYILKVTSRNILIQYVDTIGAIRAVQTLAQLAQKGGTSGIHLPQVDIQDWPAFNVRGYMHDVGRSFLSVEELKRQIDLFSRFKVNTFHWHLTENQAWRLEIKSFPQLTQAKNMTRFAGKFYTQSQVREVIDYARIRGVYVIPEVDMPGHSQAFERAMGHSMQTDVGVEELKTILNEVCALFHDAPYIHIGADEKDITYNKNGRNFVQLMIDHVKSQGQRAMIWNPIHTVNIAKSGAEMTQMWSSHGQAIPGIANIDCRYNYTNHFDVFADLVGIYKSNIYYQSTGTKEVAGAITAPWNDRLTATEDDILRQNNHYAVTIATAERAWKGGGKQYIETGGTTLPNTGEEYEEFADFERRFLHHKATTLATVRHQIPYVKQSHVRWYITEGFPNEGDTTRVFPPEQAPQQTTPLPNIYTYKGKTYKARIGTGASIYLRHTWGNNVIPTFYGTKTNPQFNQTAYAWTYIYSPTTQRVQAHIEFQNYGRSERDRAPEVGLWDRKGSKIWLNDIEIKAPVWKNAGLDISWSRVGDYEKPLQDENFTARPAISIQLKEGWNKVFIKLPFIDLSRRGVRLNKWMFTFALVDEQTGEAVNNLRYSPMQSKNAVTDELSYTLSEAEQLLTQDFKDEVGHYSPTLVAPLREAINQTKILLRTPNAQENEMQNQLQGLQQAISEIRKQLSTANIVQPRASTLQQPFWYNLSTPKRHNRYITSQGAGKNVKGASAPVNKSAWIFALRPEGTYNIINADGTYLSPDSSENTALRTTTLPPATGWSIKASSIQGLVIVTSGAVQLNQTNIKGYPLYNWGKGSNTTDTGCLFAIRPVHTNITGLSSVLTPFSSMPTHNMSGQQVPSQTQGIVIKGGMKVMQ